MKTSKFKLSAAVLSLLLVITSYCNAQTARKNDVIFLRDKTKLEVMIQEVQDQNIKYKKITDPEGPLFSVKKSEISSIEYGNGETENFEEPSQIYFGETPAPAPPVTPYGKTTPRYNLPIQTVREWDSSQLRSNYQFYLKKADNYRKMGTSGAIGGAVLMGVGIGIMAGNTANTYSSLNQYLGGYMVFLTGLGAGIPLTIVGFVKKKSYTKKALLVRNELRRRNEPFAVNFSPSYNPATQYAGLAVKISF